MEENFQPSIAKGFFREYFLSLQTTMRVQNTFIYGCFAPSVSLPSQISAGCALPLSSFRWRFSSFLAFFPKSFFRFSNW